jgi:hypothetical protein
MTTPTQPKGKAMQTIKRLAFALPMLLCLAAGCGEPPSANQGTTEQALSSVTVSNNINSTVNLGVPIISFYQAVKLPPSAFNPSVFTPLTPHYIQQNQIHAVDGSGDGMYFDAISVVVPGSHGITFQPAYSIEITARVGGVELDPVIEGTAFAGDNVIWYWAGPGDPNAATVGCQYVDIVNDNASGKGTAYNRAVCYSMGLNITALLQPYVEYRIDPTWAPIFGLSYKRNCWGDAPAANGPNNLSTTLFYSYVVTSDLVMHYPTYSPGVPADTTLTPPNCALTITHMGGGYTQLTNYGGQ